MKKLVLLVLIFGFGAAVFAAEQININTASLAQLDELTGIGPVYAQRIIDGRPYSSVDDLLKVKGIGPATLQKIKDQGLACVNCGSAQENTNDQIPKPNQIINPNSQTIAATGTMVYASGVFINEILPSPEGPDETNEWIEIYNSNNYEVDLSGWKIQDTEGTNASYVFGKDTKILANGFLVLKRPDTKIMLNNDGDGLNLFTPDGKNADSVSYKNAPLNQSYNRTGAGWQWSTTLTPGTTNIVTAVAAKNLSKSKNSVKNNNVNAGLADISQILNANQEEIKTNNPWFLFLAAVVITIISAAIVLFIKIKILNKHVRT